MSAIHDTLGLLLAAKLFAPHNSEKTILKEAADLIGGARREAYGDEKESFDRVAKLWSVILRQPVTSSQVCLMMIALKLDREANKHARDNLVDICGYAALADKVQEADNDAQANIAKRFGKSENENTEK